MRAATGFRSGRSRPRSAAAGLLALTTWLAACRGEAPPSSDLLARIDQQAVAYATFERYLAENSVDPDLGWGSDVLSALLDQFLEEELLTRLAADRGLVPAAAGHRRAAEVLLENVLEQGIGDREIADYFRRHRAEFERPERVRVRQILLEDRAAVDQALAELAAGVPFGELAARLSQVPVGSIGDGDAALAREDLPPSFAEAVFGLAPGEVSQPIATDYGFHLFQVTQRLPAGVPELSGVAEEIRARLRRELAERTLAELVEEARERYNVRVFERNLPFNYQGFYSDASSAGSD